MNRQANPETFFANYTKRRSTLPPAAWLALRVLVLLVTLALAGLLAVHPALGLKLWWGLAIPVVPALLVVAPGLWRQVCPMAFLNQIPRLTGKSRARPLPGRLKNAAFVIAVAIFLACVAARAPLLNRHGELVAVLIVGVLLVALAGGLVFAGRSGWCGTFCPLGPIQRTYGHAPLVVVPNGYCPTCVGCQKNCYDFNPRGAIFADLADTDPRYAAQRRLFIGLLPGLICAYFMQGPAPEYSYPVYLLVLLAGCCASAGLYAILTSCFPLSPHRVAAVFAALALLIFYGYAGPIILATLAHFLAFTAPEWAIAASRGTGLLAGLTLLIASLHAERLFHQAATKAVELPVDNQRKTQLRTRFGGKQGATVTDRESGVAFPVAPGATLLDAIETAGLKINYGCRAGLCGADPVVVCAGANYLSAPSDDESATLRRLGLEGKARLACMCRVSGPVVIDRDPNSAGPSTTPAAASPPATDHALAAGVKRVVIVGNGVAGISAAEQLRRLSSSLQIDVVSSEPLHFYNRMAIGRLIYGRTGMDGLQLIPDAWYGKNRVEVWRNSIVRAIDRSEQQVILATGERLPYDRLILATGAHATTPAADFLSFANAFVLRSADDAQALRSAAQVRRARRALVIGGGVLGVEAADALHHLGLHVVLLQRADRLMNAQLDAPGAARLTAYLEGIGIQVLTQAVVERWEGKGDLLRGAWLAHGPCARADLFVACLGIGANVQLARAAGLHVERGIVVDAAMRSSDPHIYAVGDVAELPGTPGGLWPIAAAQAAVAASALLGQPAAYTPPRVVLQLKCDGIDLRSFGEISARPGDEEFTAAPGDPAWWRLILRQGVLAGALYVGPPRSAKDFTRAVQEGLDLTPLRAELRRGDLTALARLASGR
ncbi:FAD-dependent oxidoreductase [Accumulibacter sp.]|uniref:FAD-dependent oxidoreductase n=1 Tax=Accumulibacter sp. TaxID=2053492 RepID=UPI002628AE82|nr:FAD-dependent oxidoreductase [Accumulibacter sp.]